MEILHVLLFPKLWSIVLVPLLLTAIARPSHSTKHNPIMYKNALMVLCDTFLATKDPNKNDYLVHRHIKYKSDEPLRGIGG